MKVLFITSYDGYGAIEFEEVYGYEGAREFVALGELPEGNGFDCKLFEFGDIDSKFIAFIRDHIQDEESARHTQFYVYPDE